MEAAAEFVVESPDVVYGPEAIEAQYEYQTTNVSREGGVLKVGCGPGARGDGEPGSRQGVAIAQGLRPGPCREEVTAWGPGLTASPPPGSPHVHALHLPDRPAGAPAWSHACRLGREQRLHAHRCRAGQ